MNKSSVTTYAPARIHFGLFSIAEELGLRFGGAGLMVKNPTTVIKAAACKKLDCTDETGLLRKNVSMWWEKNADLMPGIAGVENLPIRLELQSQPPRHSGFGSGTQIAMAVAATLFKFFELNLPNAQELAKTMRRGKRSAIGTYGFQSGGFLVDQGISTNSTISKLKTQIHFPTDWRIILLIPKREQGMHGPLENKTFDEIVDQVKIRNRERLTQLCFDSIVPAIENARYDQLGEPLYEFNRLSGQYFCEYQFGCYHSEKCAQIVEDIRGLGINTVGQSSWGPCIFAITKDQTTANEIVTKIQSDQSELYSASNIDILITQPDNDGVRFEID